MSNPFPTGILPAQGNSQGGLTDIGQSLGPTLTYTRRSPYVQQWSFGLEYSPTVKDVLEATYNGNHELNVMVGNDLNLNQLPAADLALGQAALVAPVANPFYGVAAMAGSTCGLDQSTVPAFQLMLPMPQYCDEVNNYIPTKGFSLFDSLEIKYTHRSKNLTFMGNYTWGKWIDDAEGEAAFEDIFMASITRDSNNLRAEKSVDLYDVPNAAVVSLIYRLPFGRGEKWGSKINRVTNAFLGGWQGSSISTFKQGSPLAMQVSANVASLFGGSEHANIVGNPNTPGPVAANPGCQAPSKLHTVQAWFNPCAFETPPAGSYGDSPRYLSNLRAPGYDFTDLAIEKWFQPIERIRLQFRAEMYNAFNHPILGEPYPTIGGGNFGTIGYADVSRQIQAALKIYW